MRKSAWPHQKKLNVKPIDRPVDARSQWRGKIVRNTQWNLKVREAWFFLLF